MGLLDLLMGRKAPIDQNAILQQRLQAAGVGQPAQAAPAAPAAPAQAQPPGEYSMAAFMRKIEADRQLQKQAAAAAALQESGMKVLPPGRNNRGFE